MAKAPPQEFKDIFREARLEQGWTQPEAALALGVAIRTVQSWELGERQPQLDHLRRMASVFGPSFVEEVTTRM